MNWLKSSIGAVFGGISAWEARRRLSFVNDAKVAARRLGKQFHRLPNAIDQSIVDVGQMKLPQPILTAPLLARLLIATAR